MAKYLLTPGTYTAGTAIPLIETAFHSASVRSDGTSATLRGSGCWCNPAQYDVSARAVITTAGTGIVILDITQDGNILPDASMPVPAAAGTISEQAVTQVATVDTTRIAVQATTDITIVSGNLIIARRA